MPARSDRMWIDTDTASDDVVALILALRTPGVHVEGISVVAGNVPLDMATQNALYTLHVCDVKRPVHVGAHRPLARPYSSAQMVHGHDGMGDIGLDLHGRQPDSLDAVGAMLAAFAARPGEMDLVTLGPLTNVALALRIEPRFASWVRRCVAMAGTGVLPGNVTALSEYNVWADPEAANVVFQSGMAVEMVGWDVSWKDAVIDDSLAASLRTISPLAEFAIDIQRCVREFCRTETKLDGFDFPDPIAMCVALDDSIVTADMFAPVSVQLGEGHARGQTIVDHLRITGLQHDTRVVLRADSGAFERALRAALR
ncbi:MAG: nucleoside hydrolase [Ilumatobacteraceae bacterium]|jgi:purine nucleosidase